MLKKQFWMMMPGSFGTNVQSDVQTILKAAAFVIPDSTMQRDAFDRVMRSVRSLFEGELYPDKYLDSGLAAALKEYPKADSKAFEAEKERFFEARPHAEGVYQRYEEGKERILLTEDRKEQDLLIDKALRNAVRLVLLAHEFKAQEEGRTDEAAFAQALGDIVMSHLIATRKGICDALEAAAEKVAQEYRFRAYRAGCIIVEHPSSHFPKGV